MFYEVWFIERVHACADQLLVKDAFGNLNFWQSWTLQRESKLNVVVDNIYLILTPITEALSIVGKTSLDQTAAQTLTNNGTPARGDGGGGKIRRAGPRPRDPPPSPCLGFLNRWQPIDRTTAAYWNGAENTRQVDKTLSDPSPH